MQPTLDLTIPPLRSRALWILASTLVSAEICPVLAQDDSPGSVDLSFNPPAGTTVGGSQIASAITFLPLVVQPNGKIWIGGSYDVWRRDPFGGRLNQDGSLDATGSAPPELFPDTPGLRVRNALGVQSDGAAIVWGFRPDLVESGVEIGLSRVNPDGSLDPAFRPRTYEDDPHCCSSLLPGAVQPDDRILIMSIGSFDKRPSLVRLIATGELDASFKPFEMDGEVVLRAISFQADGRIVLAGTRFAGGGARPELLRLQPNGEADAGFVPHLAPKASAPLSPPLFGGDSSVNSILVQTDGRLILAGRFALDNDPSRDNLARLHPNGSVDMSFARAAVPTNESWTVAALQADGKILLASCRDSYPGTTLTRLNPDGSLDDSFDQGAADGRVERLALQPDGKLLIAGWFTEINGVRRRNLARLNFPPPFRFGPVGWTKTGLVRLSLTTLAGRDYVLEASTNLTTWAPQVTNTASGSSLDFEDPVGTAFPQRFYRARLR